LVLEFSVSDCLSNSEVRCKVEEFSTAFETDVEAEFDIRTWGFGIRFRTTGRLMPLPPADEVGSPAFGVGLCNSTVNSGVASCRNELVDFDPTARGVIADDGKLEGACGKPLCTVVGLNVTRFSGETDESTTTVGVGVELAARAANVGGDTRLLNSESRGKKVTGVTLRVTALAEIGFGSTPCRRVGSAIFFVIETCVWGDRDRGTDADGLLADDPSLDISSSWSSWSPDAQWVFIMEAFDIHELLEGRSSIIT